MLKYINRDVSSHHNSFVNIKEKKKKKNNTRKMGKFVGIVWIMMMIIAVIVIGGEAKSEIECNVICRPHCQRFSSAGECSECHKNCNQLPPSVRKENQNNRINYDLVN